MKKRSGILIGGLIGLTALCMSCGSSYESKGDSAYQKAKKMTGAEQRIMQKRAYINYRQAITTAKKNPAKISKRLRERYLETTISRANLVISEGTASMDALDLFMADIDSQMTPDVSPALKDSYANFILAAADSAIAGSRLDEALVLIEKSAGISSNPAVANAKKDGIISNFCKENFDQAKAAIEEYDRNKKENIESAIKAEYYALLVEAYKSDYPGAADVLTKARQANLGTYCAFKAVLDEKPVKKADKFDILLAIPTVKANGGTTVLTVNMFNVSYNPQRLKAESFTLIDVNGNSVVATSASKFAPEILDTEKEGKLTLVFSTPKGKIKKLLYRYNEHKTEKYFF